MNIYSIYMVTNIVTNKVYIGFTSRNLSRRISQHKCKVSKKRTKFYNSILKHGWENFTWDIIYQSLDEHHTKHVMESYFIQEYDSYYNGYNSTLGGDGMDSLSAIEISNRPDIKKVRAAHMKERWANDIEYRTKVSESMKIRGSSPEEKMRKSIQMRQINATPERMIINKEVNLGSNSYNYNYTIYHFKHKDGREEWLTQNDMRKKHNLSQSNLTATIKGRQKSISGWVIANR